MSTTKMTLYSKNVIMITSSASRSPDYSYDTINHEERYSELVLELAYGLRAKLGH